MYLKKRTTYLLFFIAYIGALLIEKPVYGGVSVMDCFSYLLTLLVHFGLFLLLITINNAQLIPRLLEKRWFSAYAGSLSLLITLYAVLSGHYNNFLHDALLHDAPVKSSSGFWDNFVYGLCCTVIASMLYLTRRWNEQQDQFKNSQINQLQTELKYLRAQVNPHFLFNGLNTVYGYIDRGNTLARDMMVQFSDLLRYNLYEADVDTVPLAREVQYLQDYVAMQKARSNDNVAVDLVLDCKDGNIQIAPLIFMAFVENAFKYVSRGDDMPNRITIRLSEKDGIVDFFAQNSFESGEPSAGGIGLQNATRRLELLYLGRYTLDIQTQDGQYSVHLMVKL